MHLTGHMFFAQINHVLCLLCVSFCLEFKLFEKDLKDDVRRGSVSRIVFVQFSH